MSWSPKRAGFESGGCGERSFNKRVTPRIMEFDEWRVGLLAYLSRENIPVQQMPDGTIIALYPGGKGRMTPKMQWENYERYLDKITGTVLSSEFPFEEGAGIV